MWVVPTGLTVRSPGGGHYFFWYYVLLVVIVLTGFMVRNLMRTKFGRCLVAVRDNDAGCRRHGHEPGADQGLCLRSFRISGRHCAVVCTPISTGVWGFESFTLHHSIEYLAMAIVGGLGTLPGSFYGPAAIKLLDLQVENLAELMTHIFPSNMNLATAMRPFTFGLVIVLFLMFEPRGIANWWRIVRSYFKLWPFRY